MTDDQKWAVREVRIVRANVKSMSSGWEKALGATTPETLRLAARLLRARADGIGIGHAGLLDAYTKETTRLYTEATELDKLAEHREGPKR